VRRFAHLPDAERGPAIKDFIHCYSMPTKFNSATTKSIARDLCTALGVSFIETPIGEAVEAMTKLHDAMYGAAASGTTPQNIQARIRGGAMWNLANSNGGLWIQTGNMSEKAVGYTTVGGDLMGAYGLIGNCPKTVVIKLIEYLASKAPYQLPVLDLLLATEASAELAENQEDEKDLMPFEILDACYALFAGKKMTPAEVYTVLRQLYSDSELTELDPDYKPGKLKEWVKRFMKLFRISIFKWVQSPEAVHLGSLDLDRERALQLPVVQSDEWLMLESLNTLPN
jgi:NAD+ synthase (glutamine-hydrolysing)